MPSRSGSSAYSQPSYRYVSNGAPPASHASTRYGPSSFIDEYIENPNPQVPCEGQSHASHRSHHRSRTASDAGLSNAPSERTVRASRSRAPSHASLSRAPSEYPSRRGRSPPPFDAPVHPSDSVSSVSRRPRNPSHAPTRLPSSHASAHQASSHASTRRPSSHASARPHREMTPYVPVLEGPIERLSTGELAREYAPAPRAAAPHSEHTSAARMAALDREMERMAMEDHERASRRRERSRERIHAVNIRMPNGTTIEVFEMSRSRSSRGMGPRESSSRFRSGFGPDTGFEDESDGYYGGRYR